MPSQDSAPFIYDHGGIIEVPDSFVPFEELVKFLVLASVVDAA
jgi:hypothetical protein